MVFNCLKNNMDVNVNSKQCKMSNVPLMTQNYSKNLKIRISGAWADTGHVTRHGHPCQNLQISFYTFLVPTELTRAVSCDTGDCVRICYCSSMFLVPAELTRAMSGDMGTHVTFYLASFPSLPPDTTHAR